MAIPQFGDTAARTYRYALGRRYRWGEHHHAEHELLWVSSGPVGMAIDGRHWMVPPTVAVWLPAGVPHAVDCEATSRLSCVFFRPDQCPIGWTRPTTVLVDGLVRELIEALERPSADEAARRRLEAVLLDHLVPAPALPVDLPLPRDARARDIAVALTDDVSDGRTLAEWGRVVGASVRTLSRGFREGTGMTFVQWRTQARVRAALPRLIAGESVTAVAGAVGYPNVGPFIDAFRAVTGHTPRAFAAAWRPTSPISSSPPAAGSPPVRRGA